MNFISEKLNQRCNIYIPSVSNGIICLDTLFCLESFNWPSISLSFWSFTKFWFVADDVAAGGVGAILAVAEEVCSVLDGWDIMGWYMCVYVCLFSFLQPLFSWMASSFACLLVLSACLHVCVCWLFVVRCSSSLAAFLWEIGDPCVLCFVCSIR